MSKLILTLICLLVASPCQARTITVDDDGPADFNNIQAAIDNSNNGDVIEVQPGTYTGPGNRDIDFKGKAIVVRGADPNDPNVVAATIIDCNGTELERHCGFYFHNREDANSIINGLTIKNGYANYGGGLYSNCAPAITNCIITANFALYCGGGIYGCDGPIINCTITNNTVNRYGDTYGGGLFECDGLISGCVIRNNLADYGGGLSRCDGTIMNCIITENRFSEHGGGLFMCDANITDCKITGNSNTLWDNPGGGLYECNGNIRNCMVAGNKADYGGGFRQCDGTIINCVVIGNYADVGGGFDYCDGNIVNCTISGNLSNDGAGFRCCDGTITNCIVVGNSGYYGGGFFKCNAFITNCIVSGNEGRAGGAGMCNWDDSNPILTNCTFSENSAREYGGGLFNTWWSGATIKNCIFWHNNADAGREIAQKSTSDLLFVYYSDVQGGKAAVVDPSSTLNWEVGNIDADPCFVVEPNGLWTSESVYDPNTLQIILTDASMNWEHGELIDKIVNPDITQPLQFTIVSNGPNTITIWADWKTINDGGSWITKSDKYKIYDYHLRSEGWRWNGQEWICDHVTSRCIDAGNPGSSLGDEPLTLPVDPNNQWGRNLRIDMGAYGGTAEASMPPYNWAILADLTNNGIVDFVDFTHWAENWLTAGSDWPGDLDRNGVVDLADLALFADDWLKTTTWHK
jgi:hypothetical protein